MWFQNHVHLNQLKSIEKIEMSFSFMYINHLAYTNLYNYFT